MNYIKYLIDNFILIDIIKYYTIAIVTYITSLKLIDKNYMRENKLEYSILFILVIIGSYIKYRFNRVTDIIILCIIFLSIVLTIHSNKKFLYAVIINVISLCINFILYIISSAIMFLPMKLLNVNNMNIIFIFIILVYLTLIAGIWKIKRLRDGINFLKSFSKNDLQYIIILNICAIILFTIVAMNNYSENTTSKNGVIFFILAIVIFFEIKKSIEAYYKQKLLIQDLNETKKELEDKIKEVEELEKENLAFNKRSHSLAYKQKSLEFKLNKLLMKSEFADELGLTEEFKKISKQMQENEKLPKLDTTGILEVDDMLNMMQEECRLNNIDFSLQLKGNIYQMTNNFIDKSDLATLLADHIKDAIIAINHTENLNKSIMVRLGKIDENFAVYFYDSGVEFPEEIFEELGKKPITTYANEGGTGLGFMNTFDVLRKKNASLIVENLGKPSIDNYTKIIKIIFDNKNKIMFDKTKIL